jgi:hypothetical protein
MTSPSGPSAPKPASPGRRFAAFDSRVMALHQMALFGTTPIGALLIGSAFSPDSTDQKADPS